MLDSWVGSFLDYTQAIPSTNLFRVCSGIGIVAAALERKVFTIAADKAMYPNLYTILVGPPGVGKTNAVDEGRDLLNEVKGIKLSYVVTTKEFFYDLLERAHTVDLDPDVGIIYEQSALSVLADEFAVFVKRGDTDFMVALSKLFDSPKLFDKGTRTQGENIIIRPWVNILGGVTPYWLRETFSDDAFETGFPARVILVYDDKLPVIKLFTSAPARKELRQELIQDLRHIHKIRGEYLWSKAAQEFLQEWIDAGMPPAIQDPKFIHYNRRRPIQMLKLSMVMAASRSSQLVIDLINVENAKAVLLSAEASLNKVAQVMGSNPYKYQMDLIYSYIQKEGRTQLSGVPEYKVRQRLSRDMPLHFIGATLDNMIGMSMLDVVSGDTPNRMLAAGRLTYEEEQNVD